MEAKRIKASEPHLIEGKLLEDVILGGQDGLVNVLGIILGVAIATGSSKLVIISGLAASFAESISMMAVAFTSKRAAKEYYEKEKQRELDEINNLSEKEKEEIREIFLAKGFSNEDTEKLVEIYSKNKNAWLDLMMVEELGLLYDESKNELKSSFIVGISAFIASFIPLIPFFLFNAMEATIYSIILAAVMLFCGGIVKSRFTAIPWHKSAIELTLIGLIAATAGFIIGLFFNSINFI